MARKDERDANTSAGQARAQLDSILEGLAALDRAEDEGEAAVEGDMLDEDAIREQLMASALSAEVRSDWRSVGDDDTAPTHYRLLLCTGGPAVEIVGELDAHGEPDTAEIRHQDWGTPWTAIQTTTAEDASMVRFASLFYFGEG